MPCHSLSSQFCVSLMLNAFFQKSLYENSLTDYEGTVVAVHQEARSPGWVAANFVRTP